MAFLPDPLFNTHLWCHSKNFFHHYGKVAKKISTKIFYTGRSKSVLGFALWCWVPPSPTKHISENHD